MQLFYRQQLRGSLLWQRNLCALVALVLLVTVLVQSLLLLGKRERLIIMPPEIKQGFWVEGDSYSSSYLEEQGLYFAHLLLDIHPSNVLLQGEILLRYVDARSYGEFKQRLLEAQKRLVKDSLHCVFNVVEVKVNPNLLQVDLWGDLEGFVGGKRVTSTRESYRLVFSSKQGRLFLKSFTLLSSSLGKVAT